MVLSVKTCINTAISEPKGSSNRWLAGKIINLQEAIFK